MAHATYENGDVRLYQDEVGKWLVFRIELGENPAGSDLENAFVAMAEAAGPTGKAVCVALGAVERPNSRMLAALVNLLVKPDGGNREIALAAPGRNWLDMLDILGIRSSFAVVDSPESLGTG